MKLRSQFALMIFFTGACAARDAVQSSRTVAADRKVASTAFRPTHCGNRVVAFDKTVKQVCVLMEDSKLVAIEIVTNTGKRAAWNVVGPAKADGKSDAYLASFGGYTEDRVNYEGADDKLQAVFVLKVEKGQFTSDTPVELSGQSNGSSIFVVTGFESVGGA